MAPFNLISICSGSGAGDLAIRLAVPGAVTRVYVEIEAHAAATLVRKMAEGALAPDARIWDDVRTFDGRPFAGAVDCLVATYPCQPFSVAGKKLGENDPRHLWPDIARIIGECRPALVFLENVRGHLRIGFESVCRNLQALGYAIRAGLFSAEAVGASHGRVRLFALAESAGTGFPRRENPPGDGRQAQHASLERGSIELADGAGGRRRELRQPSGCDRRSAGSGGELERPFYFPPYRTGDWDRWADVLVRSKWLQPALAQAETEHLLQRVAPGLARELEFGRERIDRLRSVGEGITPLTMAFAFVSLAKAHGLEICGPTDFVLEEPDYVDLRKV